MTVHPRLRERFLHNNDLTLENVLNEAEAYEHSIWESREMGEPVHLSLNPTNMDTPSRKVQKTTTSLVQDTVKCSNCGKRGHSGSSA